MLRCRVLSSRLAKAAVLCGAMMVPGSCLAQPEAQVETQSEAPAAQPVSVVVTGVFDKSCSAQIPSAQTLSVSANDPQPIGSVSLTCNYAGTSTLRLWSLNGGVLVSPASADNGNVAQSLPYAITLGGIDLGQPASSASLTTGLTRTIEAAGEARVDAVILHLVRAASVAGAYADTLSLSVTP